MREYEMRRIRITGFRRLFSVDLEMRPFMVLVGANGVGKTTFLDALSFLSASASGTLNCTLSQWGGISNVLTRDKGKKLSFSVDIRDSNYESFKYEVMIEPTGSGYSIAKELLSQDKNCENPCIFINSTYGDICYYDIDAKGILHPNWEYNPYETSLAQTPKMYRQPEELRRILATVNHYHVLDVGLRAPVKLPQAMKPAMSPGENGEDLAPYLYYLRESDKDTFEIIIDTLRAAFPDFDTLSFPPVAAGMLTMVWNDRKFAKPVYMHELSEGTLRFIWLVALLLCPHLTAITLIDEPEVSLHPELLSLLVEVMRETSKRTQLIVATHSDRFVRFLHPSEMIVMDINEDGHAITALADSMELDDWLSEYSLDEVWQMGRMGGRS